MAISRRIFIAQLFTLVSGTVFARSKSMAHIVLLGDSIFDNGSYTNGKPDVIAQVRALLPAGWKASLLAVDGATTQGVASQLARMPKDATHLVMSVGGNNALGQSHLLDLPVKSSADALRSLAKAVQEFETSYRGVVTACMKYRLPLTLCTIYNGNFPDQDYQRRATIALAPFNDAILRIGVEKHLSVIELRQICDKPEDFANPIEPSSIGGEKIAKAIMQVATLPPYPGAGAFVVGKR